MAGNVCPACAFPVRAGHRFCSSCGAPQSPRQGEVLQSEDDARRRVQEAVGRGYHVAGMVGRGGFAEVFEAEEIGLGRRVAIKMVRPELAVRAEVVERLQREARAIAAIRHPHIVEIYAVGGGEGVAWFVMPLVVGESLAALLEREGALSVEEARRVLIQAGHALHTAHRAGVVHRDVKPDNILLDGPERRVLLMDFGIAKAIGEVEAGLTGSGMLVGTPRFMSPEQAGGDSVDHRSDIYALGVVGYRMLAGRYPFEGGTAQAVLARVLTQDPEPLRRVRPDCPDALSSVIGRSLAKDPGERWQDLGEMLEVLEGKRPAPPVGRRAGVAGWDRESEAQGRGAATDASSAAVGRFQRSVIGTGVALTGLAALDVAFGLGGASAWVAVLASGVMAARAARLWAAGHPWRALLAPGASRGAASTLAGPTASQSGEQDFGRHRSLVHSSVKARAAILRSVSLLPHQERERLPEVQETVEQVAGRVRHLARKVVTLEERIADASLRVEDLGAAPSGSSDSSVLARAQARVWELSVARDDANEELRRVVGLLHELEEAVTEGWRDDPVAAAGEARRILGVARGELTA